MLRFCSKLKPPGAVKGNSTALEGRQAITRTQYNENRDGGYEMRHNSGGLLVLAVCTLVVFFSISSFAQSDFTRDADNAAYKLKQIKKSNLQAWLTDVVVVGDKKALLFYYVSSYDDDTDELYSVTINHRGRVTSLSNKLWEGPYDSRLAIKAAWLPGAGDGEGIGLLAVLRSNGGDDCILEQARFDSDGIMTDNFSEVFSGDVKASQKSWSGTVGIGDGADGRAGVCAAAIFRSPTGGDEGISSAVLFYETGADGAMPSAETIPGNMKMVNIPGGENMQEVYASNPFWTGSRWLFPMVVNKCEAYVDSEGKNRFRTLSNSLYIGRVDKNRNSLKTPRLRKLTSDTNATYNSYRHIQFLPLEQASAPGKKPAYRLVYSHRATLDPEDQQYGWYELEIASQPIDAKGRSAGQPTMLNLPAWNHARSFDSDDWWSSSFTTPSLLTPMSTGEYALGLTRSIHWVLPDDSYNYENKLELYAVNLVTGEVRELASTNPGDDYMFDAVFNIVLGGKIVTINTCYRFNPTVRDFDNLEYSSRFSVQ